MSFGIGTHNFNKIFECLECAKNFYFEIKGLKYLAELNLNNKPKKILLNTYGWKNG